MMYTLKKAHVRQKMKGWNFHYTFTLPHHKVILKNLLPIKILKDEVIGDGQCLFTKKFTKVIRFEEPFLSLSSTFSFSEFYICGDILITLIDMGYDLNDKAIISSLRKKKEKINILNHYKDLLKNKPEFFDEKKAILNVNSFTMGDYVGGFISETSDIKDVRVKIEDNVLIVYSDARDYEEKGTIGKIPLESISNIHLEDKSTIKRRITVSRILLMGVFSITKPKSEKHHEYYILIEWANENSDIENIVFLFSDSNSKELSREAYNFIKRNLPKKSVSDISEKKSNDKNVDNMKNIESDLKVLANMKSEGLISEEDYNKKKKQLLKL